MKRILSLLLLMIPLAITILMIKPTFAADIAQDVRVGNGVPDQKDGGYFELGLGASYFASRRIATNEDDEGSGVILVISGAYRYKDFFLEATQGSFDGINLGYNFWKGKHWTADVIASSFNPSSFINDRSTDIDTMLPELERDAAIIDRKRKYTGAGFRLTGYYGDYILQYRLVTDTFGNGLTSTARLGKSWQVRNWNFHGILGASYISDKTNDHFHGISEAVATTRFQAYDPGSSVEFGAEIGVTYPISENWVFRSTARYRQSAEAARRSPLAVRDHSAAFFTTINYVF